VRHFKKSQKLHLGGGLLPMDFYRVDGFFMMEFYHNNVQLVDWRVTKYSGRNQQENFTL